MPPRPDLRHERALLRAGARVVVGMDEVGRGALAGPVSVGAVAVDLATRACPKGVADSKLLTPLARERLLPSLRRWGTARAVGHAGPDEIDALGIIAALRLAGRRALAGLGVVPDVVLLDGSHDWLSAPRQGGLFDLGGVGGTVAAEIGADPAFDSLAVRTRVKADRVCASVAAASVLAKCERDALMVALAAEHPAYCWADNKGYGAPEHLDALRALGPTTLHRRTWRLPTTPTDVSTDGPTDVHTDVPGGPSAGNVTDVADGHAAGSASAGAARSEPEGRWAMMEA